MSPARMRERTDAASTWLPATVRAGTFATLRRRLTMCVKTGVPVATALAVCACGAGVSRAASGGTATVAEPPSDIPNYVFPIAGSADLTSLNFVVWAEMYPPLYSATPSLTQVDSATSAALPPVFSHGGKTVTITLRQLKWSNGQPITSRDVQFWFNLVRANKKQWGLYTPGDLPDNVTSFKILNSRTFQLRLNKAYNQGWFTFNQLGDIYVIPQAAWDKESATGKVGNYDQTAAGAQKVFAYLSSAAKSVQSYASNPLWKVVAGPFKLTGWTQTGQVTLVKNPKYTGPAPAHLNSVVMQPYTSNDAEFLALQSGSVNYGYIPAADVKNERGIEGQGYNIEPWTEFGLSYLTYNFNNPTVGPVLKQLYVRQAFQRLIDQPTLSNRVWLNTAYPSYGPVPAKPATPYQSSAANANPYPYSPKAAAELLSQHGWTKKHGVMTCTSPGNGGRDCGDGIKAGTRLSFTVLWESGYTTADNMAAALKASFSAAGVNLNIQEEPNGSVVAASAPCTPSQSGCSWQMSYFGAADSWSFASYPSGEQLFQTGAGVNFGSWSDPKTDKLINNSLVSNSASAMQDYDTYLADELPVGWLPNPYFQESAISSKLQGVTQNPTIVVMNMNQWYLK